MGLYGAGTCTDSSYVLSGPDVSLQNVMKNCDYNIKRFAKDVETIDSCLH